jgi:putative component of membrane protein insertase Oxa1/YidC/SpoIIIJ protein YidD
VKQFCYFFIAFVLAGTLRSQTNDLGTAVLSKNFSNYQVNQNPSRKIISFKGKSLLAKVNPLNYVAAGLLYFYQGILSEQIQANCVYEISCSNYTKLCINKYGFILGSAKGIHQLTNCSESAVDECPRYKVSNTLKIKNQFDLD